MSAIASELILKEVFLGSDVVVWIVYANLFSLVLTLITKAAKHPFK